MQFKFFIGIDVSKDALDFCLVVEGKEVSVFRVENSVKSIKAALKKFNQMSNYTAREALFCLEHTGLYNNHVINCLHLEGANIWVERAIQIQRSSGLQRGKSDRVDAQRIASFCFRNQDKVKLWTPPRLVIQQLKRLTSMRERLLLIVSQLSKPLEESKRFDSKEVFNLIKNSCRASLRSVKSDLKKVDQQIADVIKSDSSLSHLFELITSVDGIGSVTACNMILTTNEFKSINDPKKYACYSGVVPFEHTSGSSIRGRTRVSHFANKNSKRLLHLAALSIIRNNGELRTYWLRKLEEGKHKMSVLNAIRNKLIQRVFAVVKRGSKYEKNYSSALC